MGRSFSEIKAKVDKNYSASSSKTNASSTARTFEDIKNSAYRSPVTNDYINSFVSDSQNYFKRMGEDSDTINFGNASSMYDRHQSTYNDLRNRARNIQSYYDANRENISDKDYKDMTDYLYSFNSNSRDALKIFKNNSQYYSQFKDENDYNSYLDLQKKNEDMLGFDLEKGKAELDNLNTVKSNYDKTSTDAKTKYNETYKAYKRAGYGEAKAKELAQKAVDELNTKNADYLTQSGYDSFDALNKDITAKTMYYNQSKLMQNAKQLSDTATQSTDFTRTSKQGKSIASEVNRLRNDEQYLDFYETNGATINDLSYKAAKYMTDEEYSVYNYYLGKGDEQSAVNYLKSIEETLSGRQGNELFEKVENSALKEIAFGMAVGVNQFATGISNIFNKDDYIPYNAYQQASGLIREDLGDNGKFLGSLEQGAYDLVTTSANMIPSIVTSAALSAINPALGEITGTALMGASAGGNAYQEMLNQGYSKEQARSYATLTGMSESLLQYLLGGIGKLGGKLSGNAIEKMVDGMANANLKFALQYAGNMASEGLEEGLQDIIDPYFKALATGEDAEAIDWSQVAYSALLGALSAGVMEGPGTVYNIATNKSKYKGNQADLVAQGLESEEGSDSRKIAEVYQAKLDKGQNLSALEINNMIEANERAIESENLSSEDNEIADIASKEDDEIQFNTKNGTVKDIDSVEFANEDTKNLYKTIQSLDINAEVGNAIATSYKETNLNPRLFMNEVTLAFTYGTTNQKSSLTALSIPTELSNRLFIAGRESAFRADNLLTQNAKARKADPVKMGEVTLHGGVAMKELNATQKSTMGVAKSLAKISNLDINVYETIKKGNKTFAVIDGQEIETAANGWFVTGTNRIFVDINAGNDYQGLGLLTLGHETGHYIRDWNAEGWRKLADSVVETIDSQSEIGSTKNFETLLSDKLSNYKAYRELGMKDYKEKTDAELESMAYEDVVCDSIVTLMTDKETFTEFSNQLKAKDKNLWNKFKNFIKSFIAKLDKYLESFKGIEAEDDAGKAVQNAAEGIRKNLRELYASAFVEANENYSNAVTGIEINSETESVAPTNLDSLRTWTASEYVKERENTINAIVNTLGVTKAEAEKYIDDINSVAKTIADDLVRLDYDANIDENATVIKPNSEYKWSVDMSTLCAKRLLFTGTFDAIQKALPNTVFSSEDIVKLRKIMEDRDYQVACGICYVESTRREIGAITNDFIEQYKKSQKTGKPITKGNGGELSVGGKSLYADKNYTPTLADLNTTDIDLVKKNHPDVYEAYLAYMNARGQAKPKLLETRAEYKGEILKHFKSKSAVESRNRAGGLRLQSFSDFEVPHLIDMMQITMDMARVGLKSQAYTKVPAFADAFGNTGIKINLSLIAKGEGIDADGNLIFDDVEGINHEEAFRLRDKYSKNVGTILVGKNDSHIIAAMADPRIDYIIPFHKSSWKESLYEALGLTGYGDYTEFQNEKPIDKNRKIKNFDPSEYWDFTKSGDENAKIYLEKCKEDGRIPKFPQFQNYPGYWKLLIDFKMYDNDGVGSPQEVVRPIFNDEVNQQILSDYKGGHRSFPVAKDVVDDFVKEYKEKNVEVKYSNRNEWHTGMTDAEVTMLEKRANKEKNAPSKYLSDMDKWLLYNNGKNSYFAIYSLHDVDENNGVMPTVLYASKGNRAISDNMAINQLLSIHKGVAYGEDSNRRSGNTSDIFVRNWDAILRGYLFSDASVGRESDERDVRIPIGNKNYRLQPALQNCLENIFKTSIKRSGGLGNIKFSDRNSYAPTFYSHMSNVIDGIKTDKVGANGVIPYLKGKGVKDEEIKWSGIATFLDGKKSLTKAELQEFAKGSMLQIEEKILSDVVVPQLDTLIDKLDSLGVRYAFDDWIEPMDGSFSFMYFMESMGELLEDGDITDEQYEQLIEDGREISDSTESDVRWKDYTTEGTTNYREILFKMPGSDYSNSSMQTHWGEKGVLAHARIDDLEASDGGKMLFIEEIQSDWHNAGQKDGYVSSMPLESTSQIKEEIISDERLAKVINKVLKSGKQRFGSKANIEWAKKRVADIFESFSSRNEVLRILANEADVFEFSKKEEELILSYEKRMSDADTSKNVPDAPFRNGKYIEYVMKRLLRMAAEGGYDSIGWTTGKMQEERWSDEYAEGYRIEYDQDIPKFMNKYGKQWGAKVEDIGIGEVDEYFDESSVYSYAVNQGIVNSRDSIEDVYDNMDGTFTIEFYDNKGELHTTTIDKPSSGEALNMVHAVKLTPLMKDSVLTKGQALYSERDMSKDTRTLLSNALAETAQNDAEKKYIADYQANIDKVNALQDGLAEVNAEIKELSFGKGQRDNERLKALKEEASKLSNKISVFDKKLLRLESTKPLMAVVEREKAKAIKKEKERSKEALAQYKERIAESRREFLERKQIGRERREATDVRARIRKISDDLKKRLNTPGEKRFIPYPLVSSVIDVCNAIDPTGRTYYVPGTTTVDVEKTRAEYDATSKAAEKFRTSKEAFLELKSQYDDLKLDNNYDFSSEFNEEFSSHIRELATAVGDTPLREMTDDQLADVYDILSDIAFMVKTASKQLGTDEAITNYQAGQEVIAEMKAVKDMGLTTNEVLSTFRNWTENPMRAVREMTAFNEDSRLMKLFNDLNDGRRKADDFRMTEQKKFDALRESKEDEKYFNEAVENPSIEVTDANGNKANISKMQALQAILTYEREQANPNRNHLDAPVRFTDVKTDVKGNYDKAFDNGSDVYVDENFIKLVNAELNEWDKVYLDVARQFFNIDSRNAVNSVTMVTKHRIVANEKNYIPYYVNDDYIAKESENISFNASLENMGMLKSVKDHATQQLVMRGLNTVIADHIDKVAKIYGLAIPVRNFNKVFNMKQTREDGGKPVKVAIRETWQKGGEKLIDQAVADLQSPRRTESAPILGNVKSAFVTSTLAGNISVWLKQASSYPTAGAFLSSKALTEALPSFGKDLSKIYDEIDEHTPNHYIRRLGLSTQELGEMNQSSGWQNKLNKKLGNASPLNWIQAMDVKTTAVLWVACKNEVKNKGVEVDTEEYWNEVTNLYNQVIEETQPMYDSLHRAEITKNSRLSQFIMFQTQPLQNSGILREGAMEYRIAKKKHGKDSEQAKTAAIKYKKAVASQLAASFVFTAMTFVASVLKHSMNAYRDDDKELTVESISKEYGKEWFTNFFNAVVPVVGNYAISIAEKIAGGNRYDILSDPTLDKINTTLDNFSKINNPSFENYLKIANDIASYFGIPAQNLYSIINGAKLHIEDAVNGEFGSFEAGVERTNKQEISIAYKAYTSGNTAKAKATINELKQSYIDKGKTEKEAKSSVQSSLTSFLKEDFLKAYKAKDDAKLTEIRKFMSQTGIYTDVVKTTQEWIKNSNKK